MQYRNRVKELRHVQFSEIENNSKNWRKHPQKQKDAMAGVLRSVGWADAVLARETESGLKLIDGHLRKEIAEDAVVPVLILDVNEEEADLILATHDPLAEMANTDQELLDNLVFGLDIDDEQTKELLEQLSSNTVDNVAQDQIPKVPVEPITKTGDLWVLGDHRLFCGDSSNPDDVARSLGGNKIEMLFTDPPYGIDYQDMKNKFDKIENDSSDPTDLITKVISLHPAKSVYLCCNWRCHSAMITALETNGINPKATIVWDKGCRIQNLDLYAKRHELIVYAGKYGGHPTVSDDVWQIKRETRNDHPTAKPIELCATAIKHATKQKQVVADPFLGSGSTLIAAEQLGRRCFGMEMSPAYCDVIVQRWETLTGKKAKKENA